MMVIDILKFMFSGIIDFFRNNFKSWKKMVEESDGFGDLAFMFLIGIVWSLWWGIVTPIFALALTVLLYNFLSKFPILGSILGSMTAVIVFILAKIRYDLYQKKTDSMYVDEKKLRR